MQCSIGEKLFDECHKNTYRKKESKELHLMNNEEREIVSFRTQLQNEGLKNVCNYHKYHFIDYYPHRYKTCCNPLSIHKNPCKKDRLFEISVEFMKSHSSHQLIPGKKMCFKCKHKLISSNQNVGSMQQYSNEIEDGEDDMSADLSFRSIAEINADLESASTISPIKNAKLSTDQRKRSIIQKADKVNTKLLKLAGVESTSKNSESNLSSYETYFDELMTAIGLKYNGSHNYNEKVSLLTLAPDFWSISKTMEYFNTTAYMVRESRKLKTDKGILSSRTISHGGTSLSKETKDLVISFYESSDNARVMGGTKNCLSIRTENGKVPKAKILLLCNLRELYLLFKKEHTDKLVGFSRFASLRPKWCIIGGGSGTHNVCVCTIHENPKLRLSAFNSSLTIDDLLKMSVCNHHSKSCMLHDCEQCPGIEGIKAELCDHSCDNDQISFKQWVTVDRTDLVEIVEDLDEFIDNLSLDIWNLTTHEFIRQQQSCYLKNLQNNLAENHLIVIGDFSENYFVIIQDAAQAIYFASKQITLHPFVVYYKDSNVLKSKCYCILSDNLDHGHIAVHAFLSSLMPRMKSLTQNQLDYIHYFTDGCAAQYKNRYLCFLFSIHYIK